MRNHLNIRIFGQVQDVFFRYSAKEQADKLSIKGCAQNLPDGSVYIEAEEEESKLEEFLAWCHQGPNLANVEKVEVEIGGLKNFRDFSII